MDLNIKPLIKAIHNIVAKKDDKKFKQGLSRLAGAKVLVGFPDTSAKRQVMEYVSPAKGKAKKWVPTKAEPEMTNAALAYIHDNGSPIQGIPRREFLRPGIKDAKEQFEPRLKKAAAAALRGDQAGMMQAYHEAGIKAVSGVKNKITRGPFQQLAKSTLAARKRKGFRGTKPLIVTGQLRNAVTYVIVEK